MNQLMDLRTIYQPMEYNLSNLPVTQAFLLRKTLLSIDSLIKICVEFNAPTEQITQLKEYRHKVAMIFTDIPIPAPQLKKLTER